MFGFVGHFVTTLEQQTSGSEFTNVVLYPDLTYCTNLVLITRSRLLTNSPNPPSGLECFRHTPLSLAVVDAGEP